MNNNPQIRTAAFTITELIIVIVIILILAAIAIPNFLEPHSAGKISKSNSASRSLATAIEAYYIEHECYPAMRPLRSFLTSDRDLKRLEKAGGLELMTVEPGRPDIGLHGLTTPTPYLSSHPIDQIAMDYLKIRVPFAYYTDGSGWIFVSPGPDGDYDTVPARDYTSAIPQPSHHLLATVTYDPTNGFKSDGDVWRVKQ